MDPDLYAIVSLTARYFFLALMLLILVRAWLMTMKDNRKARMLMNSSEQMGSVGQFLIGGRGRRRSAIPIPREGVLGSSPRADIRVRSKDIRRFHFSFESRPGGLLIVPRPHCEVALNGQSAQGRLFLRSGDTLQLGATRLTLSLYDKKHDDVPFDDEHIWGETDTPSKVKRVSDPVRNDLKDFEDELWPDD